MDKQPEIYPLEFYSDADFWMGVHAIPRRTLLMPLKNPLEFIAFGVAGPSKDLLFVARGRVLDHLGAFVARMNLAGASVELYARAPLPEHILKQYIDDDHHEQKELERPPPEPPLTAEQSYLRGSWGSMQPLSGIGDLWAGVTSFTHTEKKVVVLRIPSLSEEKYLAFGLVKVSQTDYLWTWAFVTCLGRDHADFLSEVGQGISVSSSNPPLALVEYMNACFPAGSQMQASARNVPVAFLGDEQRPRGLL